VVGAGLPGGASAAELDDPFPLRNQLPFSLLFLSPVPASARPPADRGVRVAFGLAYENTLAATDDLIRFLRQDDFQTYGGRVTLPLLKAVASVTPGRTAFVLDGETLRTVIEARALLAKRFEAGIEIPLIEHGRGFLDSIIDAYHEHLNLPDGGRPGFASDRFSAGYVGDGEEVFFDHPPGGLGLGDITLDGRAFLLREGSGRPALAAGGSLKLPTGSAAHLRGSGSTDYAASISLSKSLGRSTLHAGYAYTFVGAWRLAPDLPLRDSRSLFGTYVFSPGRNTALIVQTLRTRGPFRFRAGSDLGRVAWEVAVGLRHRLPRDLALDWALIENLDREHNTPDVGAYFGLSLLGRPLRGPRRLPVSTP